MPTHTTEQEYEAAIARFVTGQDDAPAFVLALARLEMAAREAERAAYAAEATHYGVDQ
jgi:hypothetical protein